MPLFFIVSGYLFAHKREWKSSMRSYIKKRAFSLLYPYFTLSILYIIWHFLYYRAFFVQAEPNEGITSVVLQTFSLYGYFAMWFLPCLFGGLVVFNFLRRYSLHNIVCPCLSVLVLFIKYFPFQSSTVTFVFRIIVGIVFIYFGYLFFYLFKQKKVVIVIMSCFGMMITVCSFVIPIFLPNLFPKVNIAGKSIGNVFAFYPFALSNCWLIIIVCKHLLQNSIIFNRFFAFWGKNSLIVLSMHMGVSIELAYILISKVPIQLNVTLQSVFAIIIEMIILFLIILFINRFLKSLIVFPNAKSNR